MTEQNVIEGTNVLNRSHDVMFGKQKPSYWKREVSTDGAEMKMYSYKDKTMTKVTGIDVWDREK
jgi:hypothetical protein